MSKSNRRKKASRMLSSRESKRRVRQRNSTIRKTQMESLEDRVVFSVDPIGGMLGGGISHHAVEEASPPPLAQHAHLQQHAPAGPALIQHGDLNDPPPLNQHGAQGGAGLNQPGSFDERNDIPSTFSEYVQAPDFWINRASNGIEALEGELGEIEKTLSSAHTKTGLDVARENYGFRGGGQTVAVIDSGIAYDHYALGGGFGENYRVVGGWDFTGAGDADPYDGGPEGSHGTHVAGIVGSSHETHSGVAPDVDLVGLRVFDDNGAGYFSWVEDALQWVIDHRNDFENPITAVNLSLGTEWNSSTIPSWANLENEFAQLEQHGIFISVSAGNSFDADGSHGYSTPGLSYPAASPYVVPVMSMDDSGALSYFSQRHERAIAAPGRWIYSTIPDYAGNNNGVTDDWANFSGTSMAAPYVAGASVIIREAMQFVGMTDIDQDMIYDHMLQYADSIYDSATEASYARLNIANAIDALMPEDEFGSSEIDAYNLGTIGESTNMGTMSGVVSTLDDEEFFTFTAQSNGTVTFTAANMTHSMAASWHGENGTWSGDAGTSSYTIDVVAGQEYTICLSSSDGLGYYDLSISAESSFDFIALGTATGQQTHEGLSQANEQWYQVQAGQAGYLTIDATHGGQDVTVELYNSNLELVDTGDVADRLDALAAEGEEFYVRVVGSTGDLDLRVTNAVAISGASVTLTGTAGADNITFRGGDVQHTLDFNGLTYTFQADQQTNYVLDGAGGNDAITVFGTTNDETAVMGVNSALLSGDSLSVHAKASNIVFVGGGGYDRAFMYGSQGDDTYRTYGNRVVMSGDDYYNRAQHFDETLGFANSAGDTAWMYGWTGADTYRTYGDRVIMSGGGYYNRATGFENTYGYANSADDQAWMYGGAGEDTYRTYGDRVIMSGDDYYNRATGFELTLGYANSADDVAWMYGSNGADTYNTYDDHVLMSGDDYSNRADGFSYTLGYANTSDDRAFMYGSDGKDYFRTYWDRVIMSGSGYYNRATGFHNTDGYANGVEDEAWMYAGLGAETYTTFGDRVIMSGDNFHNRANGFSYTLGYANSANDVALMYDTAGNDLYRSYTDRVIMSGDGYYNRATGFTNTYGYASTGSDMTWLHDSADDDTVHAEVWGAYMEMENGNRNESRGFDTVLAYGRNGGNNTVDEEAVDYAFHLMDGWD